MLTDPLPEDDQHDIACEGFGNYDYVRSPESQMLTNAKVIDRQIMMYQAMLILLDVL